MPSSLYIKTETVTNKILELEFSIHLVNSMKRKIPPETPNATIKPFQKSGKKSLFIYFLSTVSKEILLSIGNKKLKLNDSFEIILNQIIHLG